MFRLPSVKPWMLAVPALLALGTLLSTCQTMPSGPPASVGVATDAQDARELLQGTWLREYTADGVHVRRLLTLAPGGAFREAGRVIEAGGRVTEYVHEGTWLYDGTNLKRKYTLIDGRPPSRLNLPFATVQIAFESRNEFLGVDNVHRHRMHYRRVAPETQP